MTEGIFPKVDGEILYGSEVNTMFGMVPVGAILPWAKTLTGVPALSSNFVQCDGQVLSDADSLLDGQTMPDLNVTQSFLRGSSTSGTTGGADTHELTTAELAAHTHGLQIGTSNSAGSIVYKDGSGPVTKTVNTNSSGSGTAHNNLPTYVEVVYIIRVK